MVIPDILKHAPMFKRLDARIKVYMLVEPGCRMILESLCISSINIIPYLLNQCRERAHH